MYKKEPLKNGEIALQTPEHIFCLVVSVVTVLDARQTTLLVYIS